MRVDFSNVGKSSVLVDERGRVMRFPSRRDYINLLINKGLIKSDRDFETTEELVKSVYLDWLRRGQVGCIFAQILARPQNRSNISTLVLREPQGPRSMADEIAISFRRAVDDPCTEALSILLPEITSPEDIVGLLLDLSLISDWTVETESPWRNTLIRVGLRALIQEGVWAEVLGMGPYPFLPPTRQCPVTSLEVRTKPEKARLGKLRPWMKAGHLAQIPTNRLLTNDEFRVRFRTWTPALRKRILSGEDDKRAKAGVTFSVPAAMWTVMKSRKH